MTTTDEPTPRAMPPLAGDERATLEGFLDFHRDTLAMKCAGLTDEQLRTASVPPSVLSLLGIVRHLADVERYWFRRVLCAEDAPPLNYTPEDRDAEFTEVADADPGKAFADWRAVIAAAKERAAARELDSLGDGERQGMRFSLRWIYVHMIEEYARHNGHADFLRERIDGATGE
jgi:uncharacterized damage-inducible protein DinB